MSDLSVKLRPHELLDISEELYEHLREELKKRRIVVLGGGPSSEREVSLESASAIQSALRKRGYEAELIEFSRPRELLEKLLPLDPQETLVFVALHGRYGEDGKVQGLLESLGLTYTGSGVEGSLLGMEKGITYSVLASEGIRVPKTLRILFRERSFHEKLPEVMDSLKTFTKLNALKKLVVKPASSGSTVGVSVVEDLSQLPPALEKAYQEDPHEVLVQEFIDGRELTVPLIESLRGEPKPLATLEIVPEGGFYDYEAKYLSDKTRYLVPAPISSQLDVLLKAISTKAFKLLKCRWLARVDFRISRDNLPYLLEVNTIPGMTSHSLVPKSAAHLGISFEELAEMLALHPLGLRELKRA